MKKLLAIITFVFTAMAAMAASFEKPVMLTSVGQSADVQIVKALLKKAKLEANFNKVATVADLNGEKTLILAIGGSSKGLGAAGIKAEDEIARATALVKGAKDKGIKIIGMHIGGAARRGELSDKFITAVTGDTDYLIVVEEGNKDGLFTKMAEEKNIPIVIVPKIVNAIDPLKKAFE